MKEQKGMTYTALLIILVIIIAVAGVTFYFVKQNYDDARFETIKTNMLRTQGKIKVISQSVVAKKDETLYKGEKLSDNIEDEKVKDMIEKQIISTEEESYDGYYILKQNVLEEMGLVGITFKNGNFYIVNYKTLEIIWTQGLEIEDKVLYKLSELEAYEEEQEKIEANAQAQDNSSLQEQDTQEEGAQEQDTQEKGAQEEGSQEEILQEESTQEEANNDSQTGESE